MRYQKISMHEMNYEGILNAVVAINSFVLINNVFEPEVIAFTDTIV